MTFLERWRRNRRQPPPVPSPADRMKSTARRSWGFAKVWGMRVRTEVERGAKKAAPVAKRGVEKAAPVAKRGIERASEAGRKVSARAKARWQSRSKGGADGE